MIIVPYAFGFSRCKKHSNSAFLFENTLKRCRNANLIKLSFTKMQNFGPAFDKKNIRSTIVQLPSQVLIQIADPF